MNTSTYFTIGSVVAVISVSIYLLPLAYLVWLKARAFIADDKTPRHREGSPEGKVRARFSWGLGFDDWVDWVGCGLLITVLVVSALVAWPLHVIGCVGFAVLWVLRVASRLQRHSEDAARHVTNKKD